LHLRHLTRLRVLDLRYTDISDVGVKSLKDLPQLEKLDLSSTHVSSYDSLPNARGLDLSEP
jgi:hypothetical protein